jgi:hypothetical protein
MLLVLFNILFFYLNYCPTIPELLSYYPNTISNSIFLTRRELILRRRGTGCLLMQPLEVTGSVAICYNRIKLPLLFGDGGFAGVSV